jgi:hypothetical protein
VVSYRNGGIYPGCDVVSVGSFAWKRGEEEGERKEKEDRERRWNVLIFRQHELHPDHFPLSIVTLLAIESRRHQCPVPNGGLNECPPVVSIQLPQAPAHGAMHDAESFARRTLRFWALGGLVERLRISICIGANTSC